MKTTCIMTFEIVKTNNNGKKIINFLHPKLCPKVAPNSFAFEGYEAENLIDPNSMVRARGFLTGGGKTPPVELEFEFLCNVNINYIKMATVVGQQKCTGIEIFAKCSKSSSYVSIGKSVYDKPGLLFCNSRFYNVHSSIFAEEQDKQISYFKSNTFNIFLNAAFLKIVIFKTPNKSPCMSSVEVWGLPARSCSKVTIETVLKIVDHPASPNIHKDTQCGRNLSDGSLTNDNFKVPSDFKDDLTYEIMTLPMTLPSGKTIDQTTLDKHIENEKSFGRKPGDPFTGKKFTDKCKPILNVALKTRIDMFLTQNSHRKETYNIPRVLGTITYNQSGYFTETANTVSLGKKRKRTSSGCDTEQATSSKTELANNKCSLCADSLNLYIISSCSHVYCRQCIFTQCESLRCGMCNTEFKKEDIIKHHLQYK